VAIVATIAAGFGLTASGDALKSSSTARWAFLLAVAAVVVGIACLISLPERVRASRLDDVADYFAVRTRIAGYGAVLASALLIAAAVLAAYAVWQTADEPTINLTGSVKATDAAAVLSAQGEISGLADDDVARVVVSAGRPAAAEPSGQELAIWSIPAHGSGKFTLATELPTAKDSRDYFVEAFVGDKSVDRLQLTLPARS
jgi:hypothetical protein